MRQLLLPAHGRPRWCWPSPPPCGSRSRSRTRWRSSSATLERHPAPGSPSAAARSAPRPDGPSGYPNRHRPARRRSSAATSRAITISTLRAWATGALGQRAAARGSRRPRRLRAPWAPRSFSSTRTRSRSSSRSSPGVLHARELGGPLSSCRGRSTAAPSCWPPRARRWPSPLNHAHGCAVRSARAGASRTRAVIVVSRSLSSCSPLRSGCRLPRCSRTQLARCRDLPLLCGLTEADGRVLYGARGRKTAHCGDARRPAAPARPPAVPQCTRPAEGRRARISGNAHAPAPTHVRRHEQGSDVSGALERMNLQFRNATINSDCPGDYAPWSVLDDFLLDFTPGARSRGTWTSRCALPEFCWDLVRTQRARRADRWFCGFVLTCARPRNGSATIMCACTCCGR